MIFDEEHHSCCSLLRRNTTSKVFSAASIEMSAVPIVPSGARASIRYVPRGSATLNSPLALARMAISGVGAEPEATATNAPGTGVPSSQTTRPGWRIASDKRRYVPALSWSIHA